MAENRLSLLGRDMAVDLGTANTLVYVRGRGIVLNEPSVVAVDIKDGRPLAVGAEAKRMIGRTPSNIQAIRPLKDGVIADFEICEKMLRYFIHRVHQRRFAKPRMVICVPSGITGRGATCRDGGGRVRRRPARPTSSRSPWPRPSVPACRCTSRRATWWSTSVAGPPRSPSSPSVASSPASRCASVATSSTRRSCRSSRRSSASRSVSARRRRSRSRSVRRTRSEQELHAEIRGRDLVSGLPKTIVVSTEEIRRAIEEPVSAIIDAVKVTLDRTPPELAADIMEQGIVLTGGGSPAARARVPSAARDRHAHRRGPGPAELRRHRQRPVPGRVRSAEAGADHHFHSLTDRPVSPGWPGPGGRAAR